MALGKPPCFSRLGGNVAKTAGISLAKINVEAAEIEAIFSERGSAK
jgi:hypothetical protein